MIKGQAGQTIGAQMINTSNGAAFAGTVTVYIDGDNTGQAIGTVGSGICTAAGNGYYSYAPSLAETNFNFIAFTFIGTGAIPATIQVATLTTSQQTAISNISTPASVTVLALCIAALQRLLSGLDTPPPEDIATALQRLNDLIDAWKIENLTVYTISRILWNLTNATSYTVGVTGTIVVDRPSNADGLVFKLLDNSLANPNELPLANLTEAAYQSIALKSLTSTYPQAFYYNPTAPLGTLIPYPIPTNANLQGVMYANAPAGEVGINDTLSLPQGYRRFYRDNLAVELAPDFDMEPSPALVQSAIDSKASVKRSNVRMVEMLNEGALLGPNGQILTMGAFYSGSF